MGLIRILSALAFFVLGVGLWRYRNWARISFLSLLGLNAVLSLSGVYFFSFPLTFIPGPGNQKAYLQTSLLFGWLPFLLALGFFTRRGVSGRFQKGR